MIMTPYKFAEYLLTIQAVLLRPHQPFTWSSGWLSPVYCDNRLILSYPDIRKAVREGFVGLIKTHLPQVNAVAGVATAGIAHGALVADAMNLPFIYVRSSAKSHGTQSLIEGKIDPSKSYIVVEDLISTGGSSIKAVEAIRQAGGIVSGVVAIFSYGFPEAIQHFAASSVPFYTLTDFSALYEVAVEKGYLREEDRQALALWQQSPATWGRVGY